MDSNPDKLQLSEEEKMMFMEDADKYFTRISPDLSNGELLMKIIDEEGASEYIVQRLTYVEHQNSLFWNDRELSLWFNSKIAPKGPVDKLRWQALVCITASKKERFSCGNVVIVPDFLPEDSEEFLEYESTYGRGVIGDILEKRNSLSQLRT
jgi:hypothetical protein